MNWFFWFIYIPLIWSFVTYRFTSEKLLSQFLHPIGFNDSVNHRVLGLIWFPEKPQG